MSQLDLLPALLHHKLFLHNEDLCRQVIKDGIIVRELEPGEVLIHQGDTLNQDVFSILFGEVEILVGKRRVAVRGKYEHVGEMALIANEPRSATVKALTKTSVLCIKARLFSSLLQQFPVMWEPVARTLCERLNQRRQLLREPNNVPRIFIGSSGKNSHVAQCLRLELMNRTTCQAEAWNDPGIFGLSSIIINKLIEKAHSADFGVFIFGADDDLVSKGEAFLSPRDNVVFEAGMFTGTCGLERTFVILEEGCDPLKVPTDLSGVITAHFQRGGAADQPDLTDAIERLVLAIESLGAR